MKELCEADKDAGLKMFAKMSESTMRHATDSIFVADKADMAVCAAVVEFFRLNKVTYAIDGTHYRRPRWLLRAAQRFTVDMLRALGTFLVNGVGWVPDVHALTRGALVQAHTNLSSTRS